MQNYIEGKRRIYFYAFGCKKHANAINKFRFSISNQDVKSYIIEKYENTIKFTESKRKNESSAFYDANITKKNVISINDSILAENESEKIKYKNIKNEKFVSNNLL